MITPFVDQTSIQALAWSLVHFLWQGTVLGLAAFAVLRLSRPRPTTRYVIGVVTLAAMLVSPVATFIYLSQDTTEPGQAVMASATTNDTAASVAASKPAADVPLAGGAVFENASTTSSQPPIGPFVILTVWLSGVILLSVRLFGGWIVARRLITRAVRPVSPDIHSLVRRVAGRMALDRVVRVFESSAVSVPVMVGWMKPVVLLPAAALSGLTPTQVEALIAHELAHIRRHDYIVNLLQSVVETLLFYHPAVWWVSAQVRAEREHCCDDLAVAVCDRLVYVTALADLAAMTTTPGVALAATDGSLVSRVRRLLGRTRESRETASSWMPAMVLALVVGAMLPAGFVLARGKEVRTTEPRAFAEVWQRPRELGSTTTWAPRAVTTAQSVRGGVSGGVAGGVAGGAEGGVAGGVTGGVGVEGDVVGGVAAAIAGVIEAAAHEGLVGDAAVQAMVADPQEWRLVPDATNRWRLVTPTWPIDPASIRWRLDRDSDGKFKLVREGQLRTTRDPDLEQAERQLREHIAKLEAELRELRRHVGEMQREAGNLRERLPLQQLLATTKSLDEFALVQKELNNELNKDLFKTQLFRDQALLLQKSELDKMLATTKALQDFQEKQKFDFELQRNNLLAFVDKGRATNELAGSRLFGGQSSTTQGTGNFVWSNDADRVAIKWTGAFRISDDDKDIVWVEPGKSVQVSDGGRIFSTGVEVKGLAGDKVERVYYRNSVTRAYEPEGREFLAAMLQKVVRVSGFGAESRVERYLKQGGVNAVLGEIELLQGDYARRVYYRELLKQAKVSPAELSKIMARASETIGSDYELASLVVSALGQPQVDDATRVAIVEAAKTIGSDYEMRRALTAAIGQATTPKVASEVLTQAATIGSDYERATLLIELARKGGLTAATKGPYFELVKTLRSSYEQGRVLKAVSAMPNLPEDVLSDAVKASQTMAGDYERRQFLATSIARQPVTSKNATEVIQSAAGIRSDNEQATLLVDLARRGGVTDETAATFFPLISAMTSSYEQRRVLQAVLAGPQLSEAVMSGLLKAAASISSAYERAEVLVAVARKQALSASARSLYLAAADTIRSEHEQTRVFAELVRSERTRK